VRDVLEFRFARASVFSEPSRVDEVIADLGLASVALRPVAALSGNELRQLAIAEAFVTGASVFLVDSLSSEPRNTWSALVLAALRAEAEAGAAVVLAAREADAIAAVATRVLYLENGRVSGCGSLGSRIGPSRSEADDRFPRVVAERVH
jgi:ABC-type ATPase involved in cell division